MTVTSMQLKLFHFSMWLLSFSSRDAMHKRSLCCRTVSVRLSIRHVRVLYLSVSRWLKILSNFFLGPIAPSF